MGLVDELNHFSSQMLPVGESMLLSLSGHVVGCRSPRGNYSNVPVESADLIRIPAASGQSITFHCFQAMAAMRPRP